MCTDSVEIKQHLETIKNLKTDLEETTKQNEILSSKIEYLSNMEPVQPAICPTCNLQSAIQPAMCTKLKFENQQLETEIFF